MNQQDKDRLRELAGSASEWNAQSYRDYYAHATPSAILSLLEENEALAKKAAVLDFLHASATHDGYGWWLPEWCVHGPASSDDDPTMDQFMAGIMSYEEQPTQTKGE